MPLPAPPLPYSLPHVVVPGGAKGGAVEVHLACLEGEEDGVGGGEQVAPLRQRPTGQDHWVVDLLHQLIHQLLAVELILRHFKRRLNVSL